MGSHSSGCRGRRVSGRGLPGGTGGCVKVELEGLAPVPHRWVGQCEVRERERLGEQAPVGANDGTVADRETVGHKNSAAGALGQAGDQAQPGIRGEGTQMVVVRLVRELADRGPGRGRLEDAAAGGSHGEPWDAQGGQVSGGGRGVERGGVRRRWGGDGCREWDGEKNWPFACPGGPPPSASEGSTGEAEQREASDMETADPSERERERAESGGEAASDAGAPPIGGSGSRLKRNEGRDGASVTGAVVAVKGVAAGGFAG